jgi:hypothetical protein
LHTHTKKKEKKRTHTRERERRQKSSSKTLNPKTSKKVPKSILGRGQKNVHIIVGVTNDHLLLCDSLSKKKAVERHHHHHHHEEEEEEGVEKRGGVARAKFV